MAVLILARKETETFFNKSGTYTIKQAMDEPDDDEIFGVCDGNSYITLDKSQLEIIIQDFQIALDSWDKCAEKVVEDE